MSILPIEPSKKFKIIGFLSGIVILMLLMQSVNVVMAVYPSYEDRSLYDVYPRAPNDLAYPFQSHSFYSNYTHCWYTFQYDNYYQYLPATTRGGIFVQVTDFDGNIVSTEIISELVIGSEGSQSLDDYDVSVDKHGQRVYLVAKHTGTVYCLYGLVNSATRGIDWVSRDEVVPSGFYGSTKGLGSYCDDRGIIIHGSYKTGTYYGGWMRVSNSTTNYDWTFSTTPEDIWIAVRSVNLGNQFYHWIDIEQFGDKGILIGWENYDALNFDYDLLVETCEYWEYDYLNTSVAKANWDARGMDDGAWDNLPSDAISTPNFDFIGSMDGVNYSAIYTGQQGTAGGGGLTQIRYTVCNKIVGTDTRTIYVINNTLIGDEESFVYGWTNDRNAITLMYLKETAPNQTNVIRFNMTTGTFTRHDFGEILNIGAWRTPYIMGEFAKSVTYTSQEKDYGTGTPARFNDDADTNNTIEETWFYLDNYTISGLPAFGNPPVVITPPEITDDYYDWLFMGEPYTIQMVINDTKYALIKFSDGVHDIRIEFNETRGNYFRAYSDDDESNVIGLYNTEVTQVNLTKTIKFGFILGEQIIDSYNGTWTYHLRNTQDNITIWTNGTMVETPSIYNIGGKVTYTKDEGTNNQTGRVVGGEAFELYANGTAKIKASAIFRRLQGVHLLYEMYHNGTWNAGTGRWDNIQGTAFTNFGIDVLYNGTWFNPLEMNIELGQNKIGHSNAGRDVSELTLGINWYVDGSLKRLSDKVTTYDYSYYPNGEQQSKRLSYNAWVDLWFNQLNASTVIGGRLNPSYFAMEQKGFWGWSTFSPNMENISSSAFFYDLTVNDTIISSQEIELVRFYVEIDKVQYPDLGVKFEPFQILEYKIASDRMQGIATPAFVETKVIEIPNAGFVNPIVRAVQSIGTMIWEGAFQFMRIIMGSIDSFLVMLGLPQGIFSSLINLIVVQITVVYSWMSTVAEYVVDMLYVFTSMFNWTLSFMVYILEGITWLVVWVIPIPIHVIRFIYALLTSSTFTYMGFTWDFIAGSEIMEAGYAILPYTLSYMFLMWLFFGGEDSDDLLGTPRRIVFVFESLRGAYQNVFWFLISAQNRIISMYKFVLSHIPALGGSGGEEDEG